MFTKVGRVVTVVSYGAPTSPVTTNAVAGSANVGSSFLPIATTIAYIVATSGITMQVSLSTTGVFSYGYTSSQIASGNIRCSFCYIAAV